MGSGRGQKPSASVPAPVTRSKASKLRAYYFDGAWVLAPRGWLCEGSSGSGGSQVRVRARGLGDPPSIVGYLATQGNHSVSLACSAFRSAAVQATKLGLGDWCENVSVGPGGTITRATNLVKIKDPTAGSQVHWIWWFPKRAEAAELTCFWGTADLCSTAYSAFRTLVR
jgi:hypothetical protein